MRHPESATRVPLPRVRTFAIPQPGPDRVPLRLDRGVRCSSGSVRLASEYRSVLAPEGLPLRQRHALRLRYKPGSDAGTTRQTGLEDGQQIGSREIIQSPRAFPRKSPHSTQRMTPTDTLVRNHQQGSDHCDDGFVPERLPHKRRQNSTHLEGFHRVLEGR